MINEEKQKALESALSHIEKQYGKGSVMKLGESGAHMQVETIPTGSLGLDIALGVGGVPKGRIVEIYGPESSGKTTVALHMVAEVQKRGGIAGFIDAEHALDPVYAKNIGVDIDNLYISQPDNGEQALEITETMVRSGALDIVIVDSVAALVPKAEIEGEMGDSHVGDVYKRQTPFCSSSSTFFSLFCSSAAFAVHSVSRFSTISAFLSTDSSLDKTRLSYFCSSFLRSLVSFSSSFFVRRDSSFTSNKASLFFVSAVFKASSMMLLALSSAVPTTSASFFALFSTASLQVRGTAISSATTTATITLMMIVVTGAPPYLVFIVQIQQYKFICF